MTCKNVLHIKFKISIIFSIQQNAKKYSNNEIHTHLKIIVIYFHNLQNQGLKSSSKSMPQESNHD